MATKKKAGAKKGKSAKKKGGKEGPSGKKGNK